MLVDCISVNFTPEVCQECAEGCLVFVDWGEWGRVSFHERVQEFDQEYKCYYRNCEV